MKLPEIPLTGTDLILGVLWPALVAVSVMGLAALLPFRRQWAAPVAVAIAFVAAYPLINGIAPAFPPNSAGDWLFWFAVPVGIVAGIAACVRLPAVGRLVVAAAVFGVTLFFMMQTARESRTAGEWWMLWAILVAVLAIDFLFIDAAVADDSSIFSLVGLIGILLGACVLIQMSGSFKYAMQGGAAVAATAAGAGMILLGFDRRAVTRGLAMVTVGIVGVLLAVSIEPLFVNVKIYNALLIAAAPILLLLGRRLRNSFKRPFMQAAVQLILPAIPVLIALSIAGAKAMSDLNSTEAYDPWQ